MKTIAWDVDDVLNDLMAEWLDGGWRAEHPGCRLRLKDLTENPPHGILGVDLRVYLDSLDRFRLARYASLAPLPDVLEWFETHGGNLRHLAVTAVPRTVAPLSASWVLRHYGRWITDISVVHVARDGAPPTRTKADVLRWARADVLVDDTPANIELARSMGVEPIAMPRPWNRERRSRAQILALLAERS